MRPARGLLALLLGGLLSTAAPAHEGHDHGVIAMVDALPTALAGIRVQVVTTLAPQVLLENHGKLPLSVLGNDGRAFLRIGPAGVEADVHHPDWLAAYLPGGLPGRQPGTDAAWRKIKAEPAWGWFDTRLSEGEAGEDWEIPVLIGSQRSQLRGYFQPSVQTGYWRAAWRSPPQLPPGVALMLIPGQPWGLMLSNDGNVPVTVLAADGQPFLRIGPAGVALHPPGPSDWTPVSRGQRHVWVDARTQPAHPGTRAGELHDWQLTLLQGNRRWPLEGRSEWVELMRHGK